MAPVSKVVVVFAAFAASTAVDVTNSRPYLGMVSIVTVASVAKRNTLPKKSVTTSCEERYDGGAAGWQERVWRGARFQSTVYTRVLRYKRVT